MSVMDKFISSLKLNPDENDEGFYDDDSYYDEPERVHRPTPAKEEYSSDDERIVKKVAPKVTPLRQVKKTSGTGDVCVIKPTTFDEAREITETLLTNRTVVLNLEGLDVDIAQRIIDFTSGSCFAISGNLQKISHYIFIITPQSVDISGDFQDILSGSFDVPFSNGI